KNTLGSISGLALVILIFFGRSVIGSRPFHIAAILAAAACLVGSQSGAGFVTLGLMTCVVLFFRALTRMRQSSRILFGSLTLLIGPILVLLSLPLISIILESLGKSPDLTGRLPL